MFNLFHLLVPGDRWHTLISMPSSRTNFCSSTFHSRTRFALEPPQLKVMSNFRALRYRSFRKWWHQRRTLSTAN